MFSAALAAVPHQASAVLAAPSLPILYHHPSASFAHQQHQFLHQQQLQQPEPEPPGTGSTLPSRNDILRLNYSIHELSDLVPCSLRPNQLGSLRSLVGSPKVCFFLPSNQPWPDCPTHLQPPTFTLPPSTTFPYLYQPHNTFCQVRTLLHASSFV